MSILLLPVVKKRVLIYQTQVKIVLNSIFKSVLSA